ncbi:MAG: hypothetical protein HAW62_02190 [Endozoicomonadaceae bacterium]|nr:hypothetical protein [Endozoicomonadaceae bacterium]
MMFNPYQLIEFKQQSKQQNITNVMSQSTSQSPMIPFHWNGKISIESSSVQSHNMQLNSDGWFTLFEPTD